jgi:hypothetical protein
MALAGVALFLALCNTAQAAVYRNIQYPNLPQALDAVCLDASNRYSAQAQTLFLTKPM